MPQFHKKREIGPDDDPIAVMFGEDSHAKLVSVEENDRNIPPEIMALFEEQGFSRRKFSCALRSIQPGTSAGQGGYIKSWDRTIPTIDWIARMYGPGEYSLTFSWRGLDAESKKTKSHIESIYITVDEKYRDEYEKYLLARQIEQAKEKRSMLEKAKISKTLESNLLDQGHSGNGKQLALSYVNEVSDLAEKLGWKNGGGGSIADILKACVPFIPGVMSFLSAQAENARQREERFLTMLMSMNNTSNAQLIEVLKQQSNNQDGSVMMKKMSDMIMSAIDLKDAINPEKESIVDKIVSIVTAVAPVVLGMAGMSRQQREANPMFKAAQGYVASSPDFQKMQQDPEVLAGVISRLDDFYGTEQTDGILSVAGMQRPQDCAPDPEKRAPVNQRYNTREQQPEENPVSQAMGA